VVVRHVLIVYSTTEGQTRRIAAFAADAAIAVGSGATLLPVEEAVIGPDGELPGGGRADCVLVAAAIHVGRHSPSVLRFVQRHAAVLRELPTAFLSVSMSAAAARTRSEAERYVDSFLNEARWQPTLRGTVAGALRFEEYGLLKRLLMKRVVKIRGLDVDTTRNHEFTNWNDVRDFTLSLLSLPTEPTPPAASSTGLHLGL
jgi:menaquinone-dependent protoporphyrinogen oxidase